MPAGVLAGAEEGAEEQEGAHPRHGLHRSRSPRACPPLRRRAVAVAVADMALTPQHARVMAAVPPPTREGAASGRIRPSGALLDHLQWSVWRVACC